MSTDDRTTSYAIMLYPESVDLDLVRMYLQSRHVCSALSPLHDLDVYNEIDALDWDKRVKEGKINPEESVRPVPGQRKKPHYHLIVNFGRSKKSARQVLDLVHEFCPSVRWVEPIRNLEGYVRYLCHLDDDDKPTYDVKDVWTSAGFDTSALWAVSKAAKRGSLGELCDYIREYHIYNFAELVDVVHLLDNPALWDCVRESSFMLSKYMEGRQALSTGALRSSCDPVAVAKAIRLGVDPESGVIPEVREVA